MTSVFALQRALLTVGAGPYRSLVGTAWTSPAFILTVGVCSEQTYSTSMLTETYTAFSVCTTTDISTFM